MIEPIISTGAALVGAGAWFADKLLGPSADELGKQLKVFLGARMDKIFGRMREIGLSETAKPLPVGFAYLALQKASFSEDHDALTEMWAHLLLNASESYSAEYNAYADALSQLGHDEVRLLDILDNLPSQEQAIEPPGQEKHFERAFLQVPRTSFELIRWVEDFNSRKSLGINQTYHWPIMISSYAYLTVSTQIIPTHMVWGATINLLERQALIRHFKVSVEDIYLEGLYPTSFGRQFISACRSTKISNSEKTQK